MDSDPNSELLKAADAIETGVDVLVEVPEINIGRNLVLSTLFVLTIEAINIYLYVKS